MAAQHDPKPSSVEVPKPKKTAKFVETSHRAANGKRIEKKTNTDLLDLHITKEKQKMKKKKPLTRLQKIRRYLGDMGLMKPILDNGHAVGEEEPDLDLSDPRVFLGCVRFKPEWVVDSETSKYYHWKMLVSAAILYNVLVLPLRAVFREMDCEEFQTGFMAADYSADALYFVDLFVCMFTGFLNREEGLTVTEPERLIRHWSHELIGKLDVVSILPLDLMFLWTGSGKPYPAIRFNRLLKFGRFRDFLDMSEGRSSMPDIFRLGAILFQFIMLIHLNACIYFFLSETVGFDYSEFVYPGEAEWRKHPADQNENDTLTQKYTWSVYWSMQTLTMIGITVQPEMEWEFLYMFGNMLVSVMLFSQILGNVSRTVLNASAHSRQFRTRMDIVLNYLDLRGVTGKLRQKVLGYFEYQWMHHQVVDEKHALGFLPTRIQSAMAMKVHLQTLRHVRIFQGVEPGLLQDLVLKLKLQVFMSGEYICKKGDIGKELYIVKKGCLEVVSDDGINVFAMLGEGSVFGEISLLNMAGMKSGNRRTANVRSVGYSDLFCLSKEDLWAALAEYPEGRARMLEVGRAILVKDNLLNVEVADQVEQKQNQFIGKIEKVQAGVDNLEMKLAHLLAEQQASNRKLQQRLERAEKRMILEGSLQPPPKTRKKGLFPNSNFA